MPDRSPGGVSRASRARASGTDATIVAPAPRARARNVLVWLTNLPPGRAVPAARRRGPRPWHRLTAPGRDDTDLARLPRSATATRSTCCSTATSTACTRSAAASAATRRRARRHPGGAHRDHPLASRASTGAPRSPPGPPHRGERRARRGPAPQAAARSRPRPLRPRPVRAAGRRSRARRRPPRPRRRARRGSPRTSGSPSCCATSPTSTTRRSPTILDIPLGTVRSRIARGRAALAVELGPTPANLGNPAADVQEHRPWLTSAPPTPPSATTPTRRSARSLDGELDAFAAELGAHRGRALRAHARRVAASVDAGSPSSTGRAPSVQAPVAARSTTSPAGGSCAPAPTRQPAAHRARPRTRSVGRGSSRVAAAGAHRRRRASASRCSSIGRRERRQLDGEQRRRRRDRTRRCAVTSATSATSTQRRRRSRALLRGQAPRQGRRRARRRLAEAARRPRPPPVARRELDTTAPLASAAHVDPATCAQRARRHAGT